MSLNLIRNLVCRIPSRRLVPQVCTVRKLMKLYEPDYLEKLKPEIPEYKAVTIEIKGYDFPVLESFQEFIHRIAQNLEIEVEDGWALPPEHWKVTKLKPQSSVVESEYLLRKYQRYLKIVDAPTTLTSLLIDIIQTALPAGVSLQIMEHQTEHEEARYVPDHALEELKVQLEELGGPLKKK